MTGKKSAFTRLVKPFAQIGTRAKALWLSCTRNLTTRVSPLVKIQDKPLSTSGLSQPSFAGAHSYGFTLAETLIVLATLGVIAVMVVPNLVKNQTETPNRTKIRKALTSYEEIVETMRITNNLTTVEGTTTSSLNGYTNNDDNCTNGRAYFKIAKESSDNNKCKFRTADGLWWDITTASKPIVAFKEEDLTSAKAISPIDNVAFYMTVTDGPSNSFLVNNPETDARKALVFAKLTDDSEFMKKCKANMNADGSCTIQTDIASVTYRPQTLSGESVTIPNPCIKNGEVENPCISEVGKVNWVAEPINFVDSNCNNDASNPSVGCINFKKAISEENCKPENSTFSLCSTSGDYYALSKRMCSQSGGRMANIAEIKASGKYTDARIFRSSEENGAYPQSIVFYISRSGMMGNIYKSQDSDAMALCVAE